MHVVKGADSLGCNPSKSSDHLMDETSHSTDSVVESKVTKKVGEVYDRSYGKNAASSPEKMLICMCRSPEAGVTDPGTGAIHSDFKSL